LLEVNPTSIVSLKNIIKSFNANDYVKDIFLTDASTFKVPSPNSVDIVLIECMQHALAREPQVAITYNLVSQINKNVILIPEEISLHIALIDSEKKNSYLMNSESSVRKLDFYTNVKPVLVLNKETIENNPEKSFPKIEVILPEETVKSSDILAVTTEITIYKNEKLTIDDSGLTIPLILTYLKNKKLKGVISQYIINENPGLETTLIS
jgi:predicted RNA methylase